MILKVFNFGSGEWGVGTCTERPNSASPRVAEVVGSGGAGEAGGAGGEELLIIAQCPIPLYTTRLVYANLCLLG